MSNYRKTSNALVSLGWLAVPVVLGLVFGVLCLAALLFQLGWNNGVVGCAQAAGATVGKVGFWNAFGGSIALTTIGRTLHNSSQSTVKSD